MSFNDNDTYNSDDEQFEYDAYSDYDFDDTDDFDDDDSELKEMRAKRRSNADAKKKTYIRWDNVAIFILVPILLVLLIVLIVKFIGEKKDESENIGVSSSVTREDGTVVSGITDTSSNEGDVTTSAPVSETTPITTTEEPKPLYPVECDIEVVDGVTYINGILVINKTYGVPESYAPGENPVAIAKLQEMYSSAAEDGLKLWTASGYRTYDYQKNLYEKYAKRDGYEAADTYSARPGFSEHESGLAFDVNDPSPDFNDTPEAKWLAEHCAEFGFIIRYPDGKEDITGFMYESWHVRYVGEEVAQLIMENGICLEEYFGITSCYSDETEIIGN